eukprot:6117315-Amphidinium_carterae.1
MQMRAIVECHRALKLCVPYSRLNSPTRMQDLPPNPGTNGGGGQFGGLSGFLDLFGELQLEHRCLGTGNSYCGVWGELLAGIVTLHTSVRLVPRAFGCMGMFPGWRKKDTHAQAKC